ncbi:hypothetical protein NUU61_008730 [Penicillium alfredii]|uniref:Uncharacterized protein n=1 Tax=Penicillium alfredii TaxID=1506179 RepID=A0A9W9JWP0_9EURO|nr:uncharacterized protein NUU61_008730 [Penicillium alfredii]KAJ5084151.1 hypothetical protein NUU61_008730 [Penicillium alfredii]
MGGLALQTRDDWLYKIPPKHVESFIEAGLIRCSDFRDEDVQDRAKTDALGKLFTVVQSAWVTGTVIAHRYRCLCGVWGFDLRILVVQANRHDDPDCEFSAL